jgi:hypothetical protein
VLRARDEKYPAKRSAVAAPSLAWWVISLLAKTEQRAVIGIASAAPRARASASFGPRPKRPAILSRFSPVPEEHLSFSR